MAYKRKIINSFILCAFLFAFGAHQSVIAQQITVTGDWVYTITSADYGSVTWDSPYFSITSAADQIIVDIFKYTGFLYWLWETLDNYAWIVTIGYSDESNWHSEFRLYARRTGNGNSPYGGTITGGTSATLIPRGGGSTNFFSGTKAKTGIPVQYQLGNISALVPQGSYDATIVYTIIAN